MPPSSSSSPSSSTSTFTRLVVLCLLCLAVVLVEWKRSPSPMHRSNFSLADVQSSGSSAATSTSTRTSISPPSSPSSAAAAAVTPSALLFPPSVVSLADEANFLESQMKTPRDEPAALEHLGAVIACSQNIESGRRSSWIIGGSCREFPDFSPALRPYETSSRELSCDFPNAKQQQKQSDDEEDYSSWHPSARLYFERKFSFRESDVPATKFSWLSPGITNFDRFQYFSSWQFDSFLPYQQHRGTNKQQQSSQSSSPPLRRLRGFHDAALEGVYRVENFCLSPLGGMSGIAPQLAPFLGRDETRNTFFPLFTTRTMLSPETVVTMSSRAAASLSDADFDQRPVVFIEPGPRGGGDNTAHTLLRFLSLLGQLSMPGLKWTKTNNNNTSSKSTRKNPLSFELRPLIVLLFNSESPTSPALRLFLRALDLPVATVTIPEPMGKKENSASVKMVGTMTKAWARRGRKLSVETALLERYSKIDGEEEEQQQEELQQRQQQTQKRSSNVRRGGDSSSSSFLSKSLSVCFSTGIVWQNCYSCPAEKHGGSRRKVAPAPETESYSFGMFTPATPARVKILDTYRRLIDSCLPFPKSSNNLLPNDPPHPSSLPLVFFNIRQRNRFFIDGAIYWDLVRRRVIGRGLVRDIFFGEPNHGSRAAYMDKLRSAAIFVGVHGGAFTGIALLPKGSVVIELSFAHHTFRCPWSKTCWFGPYSSALGHEHYVVTVNATYGRVQSSGGADWSVWTSPGALTKILSTAACRWLQRTNSFALDERCKSLWEIGGNLLSSSGRDNKNNSGSAGTIIDLENAPAVGDEHHLADLILMLSGVSIFKTDSLRQQLSQLSVALYALQTEVLLQRTSKVLEGYPASFWNLLLGQWWSGAATASLRRGDPGLKVRWDAKLSPREKEFSLRRVACLDLFGGGGKRWCLWARPLLNVTTARIPAPLTSAARQGNGA